MKVIISVCLGCLCFQVTLESRSSVVLTIVSHTHARTYRNLGVSYFEYFDSFPSRRSGHIFSYSQDCVVTSHSHGHTGPDRTVRRNWVSWMKTNNFFHIIKHIKCNEKLYSWKIFEKTSSGRVRRFGEAEGRWRCLLLAYLAAAVHLISVPG